MSGDPYFKVSQHARGQFSRPAVLHMPFTYFPDEVGGTEIHVAALIRALQGRGIEGAVAVPGRCDHAYMHAGIPVYRLGITSHPDLAHAYGAPDRQVAHSFGTLLTRLRPRIVHLHARTAAVSEALADAAHAAGARIVFTYHTPAVSCVRGAMMRMGRVPCDGLLDRRRCSICVLDAHGVPPLLRDAVAYIPDPVADLAARAVPVGRTATALRLPALVGAAHRGFRELMHNAERIVATCLWVHDALRLNGVPDNKLVLCRQGLAWSGEWETVPRPAARHERAPGILRIGYFGRLDPAKGIDTLVDALRRVPDAAVSRHFCRPAGRVRRLCPPTRTLRRRRPAYRLPGRAAARGGIRGDAGVRHHCRPVALP